MISAFEEFVYNFGDSITIVNKENRITDGIIEKDERGHIVYDENEIDTIGRVKLVRGSEQLVKNGILKVGDATGEFLLDDQPYIRSKNILILKQNINGKIIESKFTIQRPVIKKTHIESNLKRVEM